MAGNQEQSKNVVLISALLVFALGWFNSEKEGKAPSARFLIGAGVTFTLLSFLADFSPQAANALAMAIATTALFSEGGGVLTYLNKEGELDTPDKKAEQDKRGDPKTSPKAAQPIVKTDGSDVTVNDPGLDLNNPTITP
jgi:hypothetical protein